jgi:hypothetical protein
MITHAGNKLFMGNESISEVMFHRELKGQGYEIENKYFYKKLLVLFYVNTRTFSVFLNFKNVHLKNTVIFFLNHCITLITTGDSLRTEFPD